MSNADAAARNIRRAIEAGQAEAARELAKVGERIVADIRASLSSPAAPSPPGAPPARRTGTLQASWRSEMGTDAKGRTVVRISATTPGPDPVAAYLEFGTSRMAARPALTPAVERALPTIPAAVGRAWTTGVRRGARQAKGRR